MKHNKSISIIFTIFFCLFILNFNHVYAMENFNHQKNNQNIKKSTSHICNSEKPERRNILSPKIHKLNLDNKVNKFILNPDDNLTSRTNPINISKNYKTDLNILNNEVDDFILNPDDNLTSKTNPMNISKIYKNDISDNHNKIHTQYKIKDTYNNLNFNYSYDADADSDQK